MKRLLLIFASLLLSLSYGEALRGPNALSQNPSFEIGVNFSQRQRLESDGACQATLIQRTPSRSGSRCTFITAAHCLSVPGWGSPAQIISRETGTLSDFQIVFRGDYQSHSEEDVALVHFEQGCSADLDGMIMPLGDLPETSVDSQGMPLQVFQASRTFGRLFSGSLSSKYHPSKKLLTVLLGHGQVNGLVQSFAVFPGDSGGGVFLQNRSGQLELIGVLSMGIYHQKVASHQELESTGAVENAFVSDMAWVQDKLLEAVQPTPASLSSDILKIWPLR